MCRNIHTLFNYEPPATHHEVEDAALQYVRKISGFTKPSRANEEAFARAVDEVAAATQRLIDSLTPRELEVLRLLSDGLRNATIAERLFLSSRTVEHHVSAILRKLNAQSRGAAVAEAARLALLQDG